MLVSTLIDESLEHQLNQIGMARGRSQMHRITLKTIGTIGLCARTQKIAAKVQLTQQDCIAQRYLQKLLLVGLLYK